MTDWLKSNASTIGAWAALIAASLIIFWATRGTQFRQLGIGLLTASVSLLVAMAVFEAIWQGLAMWLDRPDTKEGA